MPQIILGNTTISDTTGPYIIAEIGVNHEGSMDRAKSLIDLAKQSGAHAAKFQTYKAETIAAQDSPAYWDLAMEPTTNQFELFKKFDAFGTEEYRELAEYCGQSGIDFVSTPFDLEAVDLLDPWMPFFKVASADLTNIPLLRKVGSKNKPVVLSTGASTLAEIDIALAELLKSGARDIALMHCILNYPTKYEDANLNMIQGLRRCYPDLVVGYSDHTLPDPDMLVLATAFLKGARVIEKHFTDDRLIKGNDHWHSMAPADLSRFVSNIDRILTLDGDTVKRPLPSEQPARMHARRSIVTFGAISKGSVIKVENLICKRPAHGISPEFFDRVIGMTAARDLDDDHILQWSDLS